MRIFFFAVAFLCAGIFSVRAVEMPQSATPDDSALFALADSA